MGNDDSFGHDDTAQGPVVTRRQLGGLVLAVSAAGLLRLPAAAASTVPRAAGPLARVHGQPYASNWFPADLVSWDPTKDPDSPFMRSTTALVDRVVDRWTRANKKARERRVLACSVFDHTDGNPAQGSPVFDYYTSEFWTYIDTLIFWGGSASEGLILAPNPTVVDAAHRNGVPVYGTLYFPPQVYGGQLQWVKDLLVKDDEGFPVARSLAAIAAYYGFEGWFFNQETDGADATLAKTMVSFLADVHRHGSKVLWYDAMTESGSVGWQGALNANNDAFFAKSDLMFVDFRWSTGSLASSAAYAKGMKREPDELFAGIDTGSYQFGAQSLMDEIFPGKGESGVSVALYRPDFTLTGTGDPTQYPERESRFWVGEDGDPSRSNPDLDGWRGMSAEISEHATVTSLPFVTYFGTGHGHQWSRDGVTQPTGDWNNLTAQDVLPTWRWLVDGASLTVDYDYAMVWRGGSSVEITGTLSDPATLALFATRVTVTDTTALKIVLAGGVTVSAVVRFLDDPETDVVVAMGEADAGWTPLTTGPLTSYSGRTLIRIGLLIDGSGAVDVHLGALWLLDGSSPLPQAPRRVVAKRSAPGHRVFWRGDAGVRYDLEAINPDKTRTWLGATTAEAFYVATLAQGVKQIAVVPIGTDGRRGPEGLAAVPRTFFRGTEFGPTHGGCQAGQPTAAAADRRAVRRATGVATIGPAAGRTALGGHRDRLAARPVPARVPTVRRATSPSRRPCPVHRPARRGEYPGRPAGDLRGQGQLARGAADRGRRGCDRDVGARGSAAAHRTASRRPDRGDLPRPPVPCPALTRAPGRLPPSTSRLNGLT